MDLGETVGNFLFSATFPNTYAYHRPFIEQFVNACYELEVDASSLVTHTCITTSHSHACPRDFFACDRLICLHAMSQSFVTPYALHDDNTCLVSHLSNAWLIW